MRISPHESITGIRTAARGRKKKGNSHHSSLIALFACAICVVAAGYWLYCDHVLHYKDATGPAVPVPPGGYGSTKRSNAASTGTTAGATKNENTVSIRDIKSFVHPGAPLTIRDLKALKDNLGNEPWKTGYEALASSRHSSLEYCMRGPTRNVSRAPHVDRLLWISDMDAIWNLARMWYFTGDARYAQKSRDILLAWAENHILFSGRESALDIGDYAYKFVGAAEILRGTWPEWRDVDTEQVKHYFRRTLIPATRPYGENQYGAANKGALSLVANGLMAIFCDDAAELDSVVYKFRTLAHIGLRNSNAIGQIGDSGRDIGHAHGQFLCMAMLSEALWKQGIDIYSEMDNRLLAIGEYFARRNADLPTPFLPFGTTDAYYLVDHENQNWQHGRTALNLVYGAYAVRKNMQTPYTAARRMALPVDSENFMFEKIIDTSQALRPATLVIPSVAPVVSGLLSADIGGAVPTGSCRYANGIWTLQGGGDGIWGSGDSCYFSYREVSGDCAIIAKVESIDFSDPSAKAGVMMRTSLDEGASRGWMTISSRGQAEQNMNGFEIYGGTNYGNKAYTIAQKSYWVKMERIGKILTGYVSPDGTNWAATNVGQCNMPTTLFIGMVVCASNNDSPGSASFSNVCLTEGGGKAQTMRPEPPAAIFAAPGDGYVALRWQPAYNAQRYIVKRASAENGRFRAIATTFDANYIDRQAKSGNTYYYAVSAANSSGESGDSPADKATP